MPVNRPQPISREDIAEIHDQRGVILMKQAAEDPEQRGLAFYLRIATASDSVQRAAAYREIDGIEDKRTLEEHKYYTQEAWRLYRQRIREEKAREELGKAAKILKVVK